jgi:RNA-directed DNA polymerase
MKRIGNLVEQIAGYENLCYAFYKAKKGKQQKTEVNDYSKHLHENIKMLQAQILSGKVDVGHYHYFTIYDPKERLICAASFAERVLHHAIMNICHPVFEKHQIYDSYATRLGKGTFKALERAAFFNKQYDCYLKLDIRKYFDSINHDILKSQLCKLFKDKDLLSILFQIIESYKATENKGIPIGNLTSQYFANHYLASFDHFVKEILRIKGYVRYMDDMVFFGTKAEIQEKKIEINTYITEKLDLALKSPITSSTITGLNFLSYRIFKKHIELAGKSKKRFITDLKNSLFIYNLNNSLCDIKTIIGLLKNQYFLR